MNVIKHSHIIKLVYYLHSSCKQTDQLLCCSCFSWCFREKRSSAWDTWQTPWSWTELVGDHSKIKIYKTVLMYYCLGQWASRATVLQILVGKQLKHAGSWPSRTRIENQSKLPYCAWKQRGAHTISILTEKNTKPPNSLFKLIHIFFLVLILSMEH